ncbi:DUF2971 domain-containing protein [Aliivibrio fischeri]|nr:DUF2971 domain-containing protein [Aliivibrio fischeri]
MLKVYKYLPFSDGSKCILSSGTMKFSHYSDFNDPFDCRISYDVDKSMEYFKSRPDIFKDAGKILKLSPAKRVQRKKQMLIGVQRSLESGVYHDSVISNVGICCLTKKPDNILMWSHYAENHTGFVVEFTIDPNDQNLNMDNVEERLFGWDVIYNDTMPTVVAGTGTFDAVKDVFLTKSPEWKYESEYRVLGMNKGPGIHKFDQTTITKVIAGTKMSSDNYEELKLLVTELSEKINIKIPLVKAKMVSGQYRLDTA